MPPLSLPPCDTERRLAGVIDAGVFSKLLLELLEEAATGRLRLRLDGVERVLHLLNGLPVFAESNLLDETLGRALRAEGLVDEATLRRAREEGAARRLRLGEALIARGALAPEQIHAALREQVRERALACFDWWGARFTFEAERHFGPHAQIFALNPAALLLEATLRAQRPQALEATFEIYAAREIRLRPRARRLYDHLAQLHEGLPARLDAGLSGQELGRALGWSAYKLGALLHTLRDLDLLGSPQAPAQAPARGLGAEPTRIEPAPLTAGAPIMWDAVRSEEEALAALRGGDYARAARLLRVAASGAPSSPARRCLLAFSEGLAALHDPAAFEAASRALLSAVERAPHLALGRDLLARLYLAQERSAP
ncbi:hypothetical protein KKF91_11635 [Myxococcota bacterium]|nr:hypothetical protein [Myxococcota bacterium]MBU1431180.1 hypothetical protein [Myxococcota bacterium]MBU1897140.1 hypothetical protein [Myxococcota bacterium]